MKNGNFFRPLQTSIILALTLGCVVFFIQDGENASADKQSEHTTSTPSQENESSILLSDRVYKDGIWFRYSHDTATGICHGLVGDRWDGLKNSQVIECTPEVMRLFPDNPTKANQ